MTIAYLAQRFPSLTTTFVYREVRALRAAGLPIKTFSTWKPELNQLSEETKDFVDETYYIFPLNYAQFARRHLKYLVTRPGRYLGTFWYCLSRDHASFKNRLRTFLHFCQAIYLADEVERQKIKHLHVHFALNATTLAMIIARLTGVTYSFTAHANDIFSNPILLPEKIKSARFIVAISQYNISFLHRIVPTPDVLKKMHRVYCGIDVGQYAPPTERPKNEKPIILAVGRLVEKKGYPYLIKACKILAERGFDFECIIIGGGPEEESLRRMVEENSLSSKVKLEGIIFQERLRDYYDRADVFVLPCVVAANQDMDGIPNTLMEAMAMEIPTISTCLSGIPELIDDGQTGLLVPPQNEMALAEAIICLLNDRAFGRRLAKAGRAKVMEEFEITKNAQQLLEIFETYLKEDVYG